LLAELSRLRHGLNSKFWATYRQWQSLNCQVKKRPPHVESGQWGCNIVFYKPVKKTVVDRDTGEEEDERFFVMRGYTVFNADQVDGAAAKRLQVVDEPVQQPFVDYQPAEELIQATGATIQHGGDHAFYRPPTPERSWPNHTSGDSIVLPVKEKFNPAGSYYETAFHELAHWSEVRIGWDRTSESYSNGELIAEMTASYLSTELGVPQGESLGNHIAYLKSWLEGMRGDPSFIFKASTQASKATDFLLSLVRQEAEPVAAEGHA
jgi:antirestriction protein ArdC